MNVSSGLYTKIKSHILKLLENDKSVTIHVRNLYYLVTEIYKVKNNISPEIMRHFPRSRKWELQLKEWYPSAFQKHENNIGKETVSNLGAKIWSPLPGELKNFSSLQVFKNKLKEWKPTSCPCRLCKIYIQHVGFI